jgi:hypothetical protein
MKSDAVPDETILNFVTGWDTAFLTRGIIAVIGVLIGIVAVRVLLQRRCTVVSGCLWLLVSLTLLVFAAMPQQVVNYVIQTEYILRLRVIMGGLSVFVLLITMESIRVTRLQERYALLWMATGLGLLGAAIFPQAVNLLRAVMGMRYIEAMDAVSFMFLVLLAFHFSISVSAMQSKLDKIAQRNAILEARVEALENKATKRNESGPDEP